MTKSKKTYSEKLKDPRWQKKRLEIFTRDEWVCQSCGCGDKTLHVHHKKYVFGKNPWEYELKDLKTLCSDCHIMESIISTSIKEVKSHERTYSSELDETTFVLFGVLCKVFPYIKSNCIDEINIEKIFFAFMGIFRKLRIKMNLAGENGKTNKTGN